MQRNVCLSLLFLVFLSGCGTTSNEDAIANLKVAYMYEHGIGVPQDYATAMTWYRKAAESGLPEAQYGIGVLYDKGSGIERDSSEAARWFERAANQGFVAAEFNLANYYRAGDGVSQDYEKALAYYNKAALQGFAAAQFNLGAMYGNGEGTPQNEAEAYKWLLVAEKSGYTDAGKYLSNFRPTLKKEHLSRIEKEAEELFQAMPKSLVP